MKLWQKNIEVNKAVESFTVGMDRDFDRQLAPFDVLGSIAHVMMLQSIKLLEEREAEQLVSELKNIYKVVSQPGFSLPDTVEDIHSYVEQLLTEALGDAGKKIHAARSRNDQVLVDVKLFLRNELAGLVTAVEQFFTLLQSQSERLKTFMLPGYTHLQIAMPSSFGLWFGAYAESLVDDVVTLGAAYRIVNKNPLGSGAGYGSSFPIDRTMTTALLGFDTLNYNVVYAQMGRGKAERITAQALANLADTLARLSMDMCLYLNQNFNFVSFPAELTTGSSIMPHKKNPDVFELIRGKCNVLKALPNEITLLTTNLPSGYHRDLQLLKEHLFPAFQTLHQCLHMAALLLSQITVKEDILQDDKYKYLFSVEAVNDLVLAGLPFRDAYRQVGEAIENGTFAHAPHTAHVHQGSMGNLCNDEIRQLMNAELEKFNFEKFRLAIANLL